MPIAGEGGALKFYSYGIVAENKKLNSRTVEVTPVEDLPMLNGEIKSGLVNDTVRSQDAQGGETQIQTTAANSVPATWLPIGSSNRHTAPDVRRGEGVILYRFADSQHFFWTTLFDDLKLRKLETVIYAWSATKDENAEINADNYYFMEVSTHRGMIHLHTSKANGEYCVYDVQINTKDGVIQIVDDVGNFFMFDSKEKQIAFKNADDCYLEINKKNMTLQVPETYTLKAKNKVEEVGETIKITSGNSITEHTKAFTVEATDSLKETTGSYDLQSSGTISEKAGGPIKIDGNGVKISKGVALA
jgi:hypothetical protein